MLRTRIRAGAVAGVALSIVFAMAMTVLQVFDLFIESWTPEIGHATVVTLRVSYGLRIVFA